MRSGRQFQDITGNSGRTLNIPALPPVSGGGKFSAPFLEPAGEFPGRIARIID